MRRIFVTRQWNVIPYRVWDTDTRVGFWSYDKITVAQASRYDLDGFLEWVGERPTTEEDSYPEMDEGL